MHARIYSVVTLPFLHMIIFFFFGWWHLLSHVIAYNNPLDKSDVPSQPYRSFIHVTCGRNDASKINSMVKHNFSCPIGTKVNILSVRFDLLDAPEIAHCKDIEIMGPSLSGICDVQNITQSLRAYCYEQASCSLDTPTLRHLVGDCLHRRPLVVEYYCSAEISIAKLVCANSYIEIDCSGSVSEDFILVINATSTNEDHVVGFTCPSQLPAKTKHGSSQSIYCPSSSSLMDHFSTACNHRVNCQVGPIFNNNDVDETTFNCLPQNLLFNYTCVPRHVLKDKENGKRSSTKSKNKTSRPAPPSSIETDMSTPTVVTTAEVPKNHTQPLNSFSIVTNSLHYAGIAIGAFIIIIVCILTGYAISHCRQRYRRVRRGRKQPHQFSSGNSPHCPPHHLLRTTLMDESAGAEQLLQKIGVSSHVHHPPALLTSAGMLCDGMDYLPPLTDLVLDGSCSIEQTPGNVRLCPMTNRFSGVSSGSHPSGQNFTLPNMCNANHYSMNSPPMSGGTKGVFLNSWNQQLPSSAAASCGVTTLLQPVISTCLPQNTPETCGSSSSTSFHSSSVHPLRHCGTAAANCCRNIGGCSPISPACSSTYSSSDDTAVACVTGTKLQVPMTSALSTKHPPPNPAYVTPNQAKCYEFVDASEKLQQQLIQDILFQQQQHHQQQEQSGHPTIPSIQQSTWAETVPAGDFSTVPLDGFPMPITEFHCSQRVYTPYNPPSI